MKFSRASGNELFVFGLSPGEDRALDVAALLENVGEPGDDGGAFLKRGTVKHRRPAKKKSQSYGKWMKMDEHGSFILDLQLIY